MAEKEKETQKQIKEYLNLAEQLFAGENITIFELRMASLIIRDFVEYKKSRIKGGRSKGSGRKITDNSPEAKLNREWVRRSREKKKLKEKIKENEKT